MKKILCAVVAVIGMFIIPAMADETCDGKLYSGTWNQQVTNGNFANSTSSWNMTNGTGTVENNVLHFVNTTSQGVPNQNYNKFIVGNKYLITAQIKGSSSGSTFGAGGGAGTTAAITFNITNENEYKKLSAIVVPVNTNNTFYFYLIGAKGSIFDIKNVMAFDLTQMFGAGNEPATAEEAERLIPVIASSLNISATDGYYATNTGQAYSYCATIKVATTKYVETQFGGLSASLAAAVATVNTVVTNTITQAASIATLQAQKQTRPNDIADDNEKCPAGKKCLLVEDASGVPHWYEIVTSRLPDGYTELQYIESSGTQYIDTGIVLNSKATITTVGQFLRTSSAQESVIAIWGFMGSSGNHPRWGSGIYTSAWLMALNATEGDLSANTDKHTFVNETNGINKYNSYVDGTSIYGIDMGTNYPETYQNNTLSAYLFARNNNNTARNFSSSRVYSYNIVQNNVEVINLIPARRNSDNVVGMYDTVSGQFFTNQGTGEFVAGDPVSE